MIEDASPGRSIPVFLKQPKLAECLIHSIHTNSGTDIHKYWITGIHNTFFKCLTSMSSDFVTPDLAILHNPKSWTIKMIIHADFR